MPSNDAGLPIMDGPYHVVNPDIRGGEGGGKPTAVPHRHSVQPQHHRYQQAESLRGGREAVPPPIKMINSSRPFSNQTSEYYQQQYRTAPVPQPAVRHDDVPTTTTRTIDRVDEMSCEHSASDETRRRDVTSTHQIPVAPYGTERNNEADGDVESSKPAFRRTNDPPECRIVRIQPRETHGGQDCEEAAAAAATVTTAKNSARSVRTNLATSTRKAGQTVAADMRRNDQGVIMEDENIVVRVDSFNVVYRDANKAFATVDAHVKSALEEAKKNISFMFQTKLEAFKADIERLVKLETVKLRQSISKGVGKPEDTHKYAIFTPKTTDGEVFHMMTAAEREDLNKKCGRIKNVEKLVLKFTEPDKFGVSHVREVFRDHRMTCKSKNTFSYPGNDMKELYSYLIKIFNDSKRGPIERNQYRLTYIKCDEHSSPSSATAPAASRNRKAAAKKETIRRSRSEEYTDQSSDDERDETNGSEIVNEIPSVRDDEEEDDDDDSLLPVETSENANGYASGGGGDEDGAHYSSGSSNNRDADDDTRAVTKRKLGSRKEKRVRTVTNSYADEYLHREVDAAENQKPAKKRRSRHD